MANEAIFIRLRRDLCNRCKHLENIIDFANDAENFTSTAARNRVIAQIESVLTLMNRKFSAIGESDEIFDNAMEYMKHFK